MKQYIMGMITGASLILCAVIFIGASDNNSNYGKYQAFSHQDRGKYMINTETGELYRGEGANGSMIWRETTSPPKVLFQGRDAY